MPQDCIFADDSVDADTETTGCTATAAKLACPGPSSSSDLLTRPLCTQPAVLAAFAYWAERNIKATDPGARERIATICCRIRFPAIPVSVLWNYHMRHEFMRIFDPDKALLFRAVRHQRFCLLAPLLACTYAWFHSPGLFGCCMGAGSRTISSCSLAGAPCNRRRSRHPRGQLRALVDAAPSSAGKALKGSRF